MWCSLLSNLHSIEQNCGRPKKECFTAVVWYDLNTYSILIPYGQHWMPTVFVPLLNNKTRFDTVEKPLSEWCIPR